MNQVLYMKPPSLININQAMEVPPEDKKPTLEDLKRMKLIAGALKVTPDQIKAYFKSEFQLDHSSQLNLAQYNKTMRWINTHLGREHAETHTDLQK